MPANATELLVMEADELRRALRHVNVLLGAVETSPTRHLLLRRAQHEVVAVAERLDRLLREDLLGTPDTVDNPLTPAVDTATIGDL